MIENKTMITKKLTKDMLRVAEKYGVRFNIITKYLCLIVSIVAFFMAGKMVFVDNSSDTTSIVLYCIIGVVSIFAFYPGATVLVANKVYKNMVALSDYLEYKFNEDEIIMKSKVGKSKSKWNEDMKWCETKEYFHIQVAKNQFCSIDKNGFTVGDSDKLRELLEKKLAKL